MRNKSIHTLICFSWFWFWFWCSWRVDTYEKGIPDLEFWNLSHFFCININNVSFSVSCHIFFCRILRSRGFCICSSALLSAGFSSAFSSALAFLSKLKNPKFLATNLEKFEENWLITKKSSHLHKRIDTILDSLIFKTVFPPKVIPYNSKNDNLDLFWFGFFLFFNHHGSLRFLLPQRKKLIDPKVFCWVFNQPPPFQNLVLLSQ